MDLHTTSRPDDIRQFVLAERERCLSDREWRHRLKGYGYAVRSFGEIEVVTSLVGGREICTLPPIGTPVSE